MRHLIAEMPLLVVLASGGFAQHAGAKSQSLCAHSKHAQPAQNAAVKYLRADAALRQSYPLPPDAYSRLDSKAAAPLDAEDEKVVAAAGDALVEFYHGANLKKCDWAMSVEDGALANTSHRGAVRELVGVAILRARLRFRDANVDAAIKDAVAAITASRHLSLDGSLASVLIAYKLEDTASKILAMNLQQLSPAQTQKLARALAGVQAGSTIAQAFEAEKVLRNDFRPIVEGANSRDELVERLLTRVPILESNRELASQTVGDCGDSVKGFLRCIERQESFYRSWANRFSLPPEQFAEQFKAESEQLSKSNPLIRAFTPSLSRLRWAEAYERTRRALLQTAIAVRLEGTSALVQYRDPYNGNSFDYSVLDGGFRLESRLKEDGSSLRLATVPDSPEQRRR